MKFVVTDSEVCGQSSSQLMSKLKVKLGRSVQCSAGKSSWMYFLLAYRHCAILFIYYQCGVVELCALYRVQF